MKIDSGILATVIQIVNRRTAWLRSLKQGQSVVKITVRKTGTVLYGIYKSHSDSTITVEAARSVLDHLFRGGTLTLSQMDLRSEDITFEFLDIQMENG
jgi:hypothetical protein